MSHPSGRWCRKVAIGGKSRAFYFGRVDADPDGSKALERMNREWPYIVDGRTSPPATADDGSPDGPCTLRVLCNAFLGAKRTKLDSGELSPRSFADYVRTADGVVTHLHRDRRVDDLRPDDFRSLRTALAKRLGPVALGNEIIRCRSVFKFAFDERMIDRPIHYGNAFSRPAPKLIRKARNEAGTRMFDRDEVLLMLDALEGKEVAIDRDGEPVKVKLNPNPIMRAMTLLAVNGGLGNSDIACLPQSAIDAKGGWLAYPRVKTAIDRRIPLWPETLAALQKAIELRPKHRDPADADLCFLTEKRRQRWVRIAPKKKTKRMPKPDADAFVPVDALGTEFRKLLKALGINGRRNFYALRHSFRTIADGAKDRTACDAIMGHVDPSMGARYIEGVDDDRLRAVVETVRAWLFPAEPDASGDTGEAAGE